MASNFQIVTHRNHDNLHLKLSGDFDGDSAHTLLAYLRRMCLGTSKVFIHTNTLEHIDPFGLSVFCNNLDFMKRLSIRVMLTGENASQLFPEKKNFISILN
jgi:anti-anti-sigma factor